MAGEKKKDVTPKLDYDLAVTRLQMPHARGGFGLTPNTLPQSSAKVAMASRFVGLVGSLPPEEQQIWFPNQLANDPQLQGTGNVHSARPASSSF